ncbi:uncharacterized protein LOC118226355 [Anguilla anguilla]|uniref:uncharacterized protein LOC118226355 n=1 Tax=Anguilla anguilla TaxID=7936 RepID=UPI0015ACB716|nr:uncharacterized protein LOC118226355 [Anguilla anguilla]
MDFFFFKIFYLLLLKATVEAVASRITFHPQTPPLVLLRPFLTLNCSFDIEGDAYRVRVSAYRVRVNWFKKEGQSSGCGEPKFSSGLSNETASLVTRDRVTQWTGRNWSSLTLRDVTANDSGWYFCEVVVEIPNFQQKCNPGTEVIVPSSLRSSPATKTAAKHTTPRSPASLPHHVNAHWWVWVTVGVGSLMLAAIFIGGVRILCRRMRCQNKENPIYENMHPVHKNAGHPQPSPRPRTQQNPSDPPSSVHPGTPKIL